VEAELLPTPAKSHYTFNLRDLSKVFQGVLMTRAQFTSTQEDLVKLWCHEECRVFRDRLINEHDREYFNTLISELLRQHMGMDMEVAAFKDLLYGDYLTREDKVRAVVLVAPVDALKKRLAALTAH
jgi:dynein heavy chain, axonemal